MCAGPKSAKLRNKNQSGVRMMADELRKSRRRQPRFRTSCAVESVLESNFVWEERRVVA